MRKLIVSVIFTCLVFVGYNGVSAQASNTIWNQALEMQTGVWLMDHANRTPEGFVYFKETWGAVIQRAIAAGEPVALIERELSAIPYTLPKPDDIPYQTAAQISYEALSDQSDLSVAFLDECYVSASCRQLGIDAREWRFSYQLSYDDFMKAAGDDQRSIPRNVVIHIDAKTGDILDIEQKFANSIREAPFYWLGEF